MSADHNAIQDTVVITLTAPPTEKIKDSPHVPVSVAADPTE